MIVVGWAASFPFGYYWPERPTFTPTTTGTAVRFQVGYVGRRDLMLVRGGRRPDLIHDALREAAVRSSSRRVRLVLAEAGNRDPSWNKAFRCVGGVARWPLPQRVLVDAPAGELSPARPPTCQSEG